MIWTNGSNQVRNKHVQLCETSGSHGSEYEDDLSFGMLRRVVWYIQTDVSEALFASAISLMKRMSIYTRLHGGSQKTVIFKLNAVV
jgi:hypothetical protein